jgi:hypothetical protein
MTMQYKLDRAIVVLEVEAKTLEAHAEKLSIMARSLTDPEHQQEVIQWSHQETEKAEGIRRQNPSDERSSVFICASIPWSVLEPTSQQVQDRRRLLSEARAAPRLILGTITNSKTVTPERST